MFRAPLRRIRPATVSAARVQVPRRAVSTGPARKGTWKGAAARWGVAVGAVYFYCTSPLFADDPERAFPRFPPGSCCSGKSWEGVEGIN